MSTSLQPRLRALYRLLLRELPLRPHPSTQQHPLSHRSTAPPISLLNSQTPIHQRIRAHISSSPSSSSSSSSQSSEASSSSTPPNTASAQQPQSIDRRQIQSAHQFAQYLKAQRTYTMLLERYNPGMGMDETERIRLTARRVGMNLPVEFASDGGGDGGDLSGSGKSGTKR